MPKPRATLGDLPPVDLRRMIEWAHRYADLVEDVIRHRSGLDGAEVLGRREICRRGGRRVPESQVVAIERVARRQVNGR